MRPYGKTYSVIFALTLSVVSIAHGAGDNPFVEEEKSKAAVSPSGKGGPKGSSGGFRPDSLIEALPFAQSPAPQPSARMDRKWKIRGKVNDTVVISDEKGERIHVKNGEVFEGCLIQFPSAVCDRDMVIKALQEKLEREKKEKIAFAKEVVDLRTAFEQKEKARATLEKSVEDLVFQKDDLEGVLERLRKEHGEVLAKLKETQAAWEQSLKDGDVLKSVLQEKEAALAKAIAEAVKHKTDSMSLLEAKAQREQCTKDLEQVKEAIKEKESEAALRSEKGEALGVGVLIEYVQKSGERVPTEEYGEILVKEMNDSLIIGVPRMHADQAERSLATAARARIMQEQFIFYLLEKGIVDFAPLPSGQTAKVVQRKER